MQVRTATTSTTINGKCRKYNNLTASVLPNKKMLARNTKHLQINGAQGSKIENYNNNKITLCFSLNTTFLATPWASR
uniref:Uncharacterized protein n=1 Tax=Romanomermis culicivorax TaxID=13658 RepID=A0A915KU80_ROMCU